MNRQPNKEMAACFIAYYVQEAESEASQLNLRMKKLLC